MRLGGGGVESCEKKTVVLVPRGIVFEACFAHLQ